MVPCMLRTTYQRGADEGSSGLKEARRRTMLENTARVDRLSIQCSAKRNTV